MNASDLSCAFMGYVYDEGSAYKITLICIATMMLLISVPTFLINISIVLSIFRKRELRTPAFIIIMNLSISDSLAGCSAYVFYATTCIRFASGYDACPVAYIGTTWSYILGVTSYFTISLQTVERYLAIFYPYWYHEKITTKAVVIANVFMWIFSIAVVVFWLVTENSRAFYGILGSFALLAFVVTVTSYVLIFRKVRKIEDEIMKNQTASREDRKKIRSESKVAKATAIIVAAVVTCYTPMLFIEFYIVFIGKQTFGFSIALFCAWFLSLSNSFFNPLIACRQLTVLRRSVKEILSKLFPCVKASEVSPNITSFALSRTSQTDINFGKRFSNCA